MKLALILVVVLACDLATAGSRSNYTAWRQFKKQHGKVYATQAEEASRFNVFMAHKQLVDRHNANFSPASFTMELNHLADQLASEMMQPKTCPPEFASTRISMDELDVILASSHDDPLPDEFDWRKKEGRVGDVKDEGSQCHASWAFATAGLLEGQELAQNLTSFVTLSEQALIDCCGTNQGCDGGWPAFSLDDIADGFGAVESQHDYPYRANQRYCQKDKSKFLPMKVTGHKLLPAKDEQALKRTLVNYGPVAVSLQATDSFNLYKNGVFEDSGCKQDEPNHDVLLVGYGKDSNNSDYWIIKNSWGIKWGEGGYMRFKAGTNMCGIADFGVIANF